MATRIPASQRTREELTATETVTAFFDDMKRRGLNDPLLLVSDAAARRAESKPRSP